MTAFQGLPPGLFSFFAELERDNSREFWQANKDRWERDVHLPMQTLIDALAAEFGPLRLFRPNRDTRFSTDKSPYKLRTAATTISKSRAVGGVGYYLEASAMGMIAGYGAMMMDADQLRRFREAIDNDVSGSAFDRLCELQASQSLPISSGFQELLKTAPRGYSVDHPRIEYLRWKGAVIVQEWALADWMHTPEALDAVRGVWRGAEPLKNWLEAYVWADSSAD
ncbi:MAG: DUF2461 domain-containing protein [Thermomicrobiales bacterium]|nr:DUF2461 domain-containing protein [Thermomicrobiales bacterium]MCO5226622.1 DUF2461 domain-containing protein [Thermomicrobiales bacterium]MCO5227691.1 DUF2461 domain-containing protein [Thermomicrobiales bacterium]